jgi:hypothetical protein
MSKRMIQFEVFVLVLGLIGSVQAAPGDWVSVSSKTGDWTAVAWDGGHAYPGTTLQETALLIDSKITLSATDHLRILDNLKVAWVITSTLTINADANCAVAFTSSYGGGSADAIGTLELYGRHYAGLLRIGNETAGASGIVNVYSGGHLIGDSVGGGTAIGKDSGSGTGLVNLKGGIMDVNSSITDPTWGDPLFIYASGKINIEAGKLRVAGDQITSLTDYFISTGKIIAYSGSGTINAPVLGTGDDEGWTVVTAKPACRGTSDYLQSDFNHDCYVNFADFAIFAGNWLTCNDPQNSACQ